jgi:uncharacterized protein (TIGR02596 family)
MRKKRGFTLVELLVVVTIMLILAAISVPAISGLLESSNITQGGQVLASQISLARQVAAALNCNVEVRLLQAPNSTPAYYTAIQLWAPVPPSGTNVAVNRLINLPQGAVISGDTSTLSPVLANLSSTANTMTIAGVVTNYVSFKISPTGMVTTGSVTPYTAIASLYLTVVPLKSAAATSAPKNYVTVQINPVTGTQLVYRP